MLDRTIPFYNVILRCDEYELQNVVLPEGYSIITYRPGFENAWAQLEFEIEDFKSIEEAKTYFKDAYLQNPDLYDRLFFALNPQGEIIGSCIAWEDDRHGDKVSSLHWLVVNQKHQNQGIGRALCTATMNYLKKSDALPVYIHTQPWSWKAVALYLSMGFEIQKTDTFADYSNDYDEAMEVLNQVFYRNHVIKRS